MLTLIEIYALLLLTKPNLPENGDNAISSAVYGVATRDDGEEKGREDEVASGHTVGDHQGDL